MKSIENVISTIEDLFPIDSQYDDTNEVGERLLAQAKSNMGYTNDWRSLPENVLREYERLCIQEERRQARSALNK